MFYSHDCLIIVPKDKTASVALNYNEAHEQQLITVTIPKENFGPIWQSGVFDKINNVTGSIIDMYEDEEIVDIDKLQSVLTSDALNDDLYQEDVKGLIVQIRQLFQEALRRNTGVYFFF